MSKQVITPESLFLQKNIIDVQVSPDGSQVAYVVETNSKEFDKTETAIWLQNLGSGAKPLKLTSHSSDASPRWAPDGKRIAFISSRTGKAQLYVINARGGEAEQIATEQAPSSTPLWSPDGMHIAFKAQVEQPVAERYPGEPHELIELAKEAGKKDVARVITDINFHADGRGLIYNKFAHLFVVNLETGDCRQLTSGTRRIEDFIWNASGSALLCVVDIYCPTYARHTSAVHQIELANQATSHILNFAGSLRRLDLAPNGRWLLLTGPDNSRPPGVGVTRLWLLDLHSPSLPLQQAELRCLTSELDASCTLAHWDAGGTGLYFIKHWHGATALCWLSLEAGRAGAIGEIATGNPGVITQFDLTPDNSFVYVFSNFVTPPELYVQQDQEVTQLTQLHSDFLANHYVCAADKFTYKANDGWDIDGWIVKPLNYEQGRHYPTILNVHGGPTGAYTDSWQFPFQLMAQQGFAVVFTNPRGSVTYGEEFTHGCVSNIGGGDFQDILAGLDYAIKMDVVDASRVGITGWSYGGYMTCWSVTQTDRFKAAVAGACISNWVDLYGCGDSHVYDEGLFGGPPYIKEEEHMERSPIRFVQNVNTPILLLHGELDIRCPTSQSDQFFTALKRAGKEAVYVRYPGQYHGLKRPSYQVDRWTRTCAWFKHYLLSSN